MVWANLLLAGGCFLLSWLFAPKPEEYPRVEEAGPIPRTFGYNHINFGGYGYLPSKNPFSSEDGGGLIGHLKPPSIVEPERCDYCSSKISHADVNCQNCGAAT